MDLAELGIVFLAEGADAAIEKMDAFTEASDRAEQSEKRRLQAAVNFARTEEQRNVALANQAEYMGNVAEAAAKNAAAQDRLEERIGRAAVAMLGSKSAMLEYEAALIGASDRFADVIGKLREMEEAVSAEAAAEKAHQQAMREEQGYLLDLAKDIEYLNKTRAKEAADAEAARQKELASRQAYYDGIIKAAKEAEQAERDARHKAILDAQDATAKAVALYTEEENQKKKAADKAAADLAAADKRTADNAIKEAERKAISEIQWAQKSRDEQIRIKEQIAAYKGAGVGDETLGKMFGPGALNGTVKEVESLAHHWGNVSLNTSRARTEMIVLAHEAVQGRFSRIPASMMVFAEYTDLAALAMTGAGLAVMGTVAILATFAVAAAKGALEWDSFNKTLAITGDYTAMTVSDFYTMADSMTAVHGKVGEAKEIIGELAATGKFTKTEIETIAPAILEMSEVGGVAVKTLVGEYAKLAEDPVNASKELNKHYHYLTVEIYSQIKALEEQGDKQGAAALAEKTLAEEQGKRMEKLRGELGLISRAWLSIQEGASRAWAAMKDIGKPEDDIAKLAKLQAERAKLMTGRNDSWDTDAQYQAKLDQNNRDIIKLQNKMDNDRLDAEHKGALQRMEQAAIDAKDREDKDYNRSRSNAEKRDVEMAKMYQDSATRNALSMIKSSKITEEARLKIEQAMNDPLPSMRDNTAGYMVASENRSKALLQIANQFGLDIAVSTDRQNERVLMIENHWADKRKASAKENSTALLNEYVREANMEATEATKRAEALVVIAQRSYENQKQIENDEFAIQRSNAKARSQTGFLEADAYAAHIQRMRELNSNALQDELAYYADARAVREQQTANIIAAEQAQVTNTEEGRKKKEASIQKAYATLKEYNDHMDVLEQKARERSQMNVAKVEADTYKVLNADMNSVINTLEKKIEKEQEHLDKLLVSKATQATLSAQEQEFAALALEDSLRTLEAKKAEVDGDVKLMRVYDEQIAKIKKIIELREKSKGLEEQTSVAQKELDRQKALEAEWEKGWNQFNNLGQEAFNALIQGGDNMAKKIGDMLKKALAEAIYSQTVKPIILQIYTSFMGGGGETGAKVLAGLGGGAGGSNGGMGGLGSAWDFMNNGFSKLGDKIVTGFETFATSGIGASLGLSTATPLVEAFDAGAISAEAFANALAAGTETVNVMGTAATTVSSGLSSVSSMLSAIPVWGWVAMAAIASVAGGPKIDKVGDGLNAHLVAGGTSNAVLRTDYSEDHHGVFGIGSFTTKNSEWRDASPEMNSGLNAAVAAITSTAKAYAAAIGLSAEAVDGFTKDIAIDLTGLDAEGQRKAIEEALVNYANDMLDSAYGDVLNILAKTGETSSETMQRLASDLLQVNAMFAELNMPLIDISIQGAAAAESLIASKGGLSELRAQLELLANVHLNAQNSIWDMQYGMGTNQDKYNMLDVKGAEYDAKMRQATSIVDISNFANKEIELLKQAWSLLDDQQKKDTFGQFEEKINAIDSYVASKGADDINAAKAKDEATAKAIADAVQAAVTKAMEASVTAMNNAARAIDDKAKEPAVVVNVANAGAEVAIGRGFN